MCIRDRASRSPRWGGWSGTSTRWWRAATGTARRRVRVRGVSRTGGFSPSPVGAVGAFGGDPFGQRGQAGAGLLLQLGLGGAITLHRRGDRVHVGLGEHHHPGATVLGVAQRRRLMTLVSLRTVAARLPAARLTGHVASPLREAELPLCAR